jgi:hypothetical protein
MPPLFFIVFAEFALFTPKRLALTRTHFLSRWSAETNPGWLV